MAASVEAASPVVFVDGIPEPALRVSQMTLASPMDHRFAVVVCTTPDGLDLSLSDQEVAVGLPHALVDGDVRWQVLLSGHLSDREDALSVGAQDSELTIKDRLAEVLDGPADVLGPWPDVGLSLGDVLDRLAVLIQAQLVAACDAECLSVMIDSSSPTLMTVASVLSSVLDDAGLALQQTLGPSPEQLTRTLTLLPARAGRLSVLSWPDRSGRGGFVRSAQVDREQRPPRAWLAQGDRPIVEDTFVLQPGWDPGLEGQPDSDYGRLTSTDYSRFGSVYRSWVLNEDGAFSGEPFNLARFDAGQLFELPGTINGPIFLGGCLARDASGLAIGPVIESSTDSGATWSAYPGQARRMTDRAGVLFEDDVLPAPILAAAKAQTIRLRVTASLTGPDPIAARRWDGNPFAGAGPDRLIRYGKAFQWRRVVPGSLHASALDAGTLGADLTDDRAALRSALRDAIARSPGAALAATVELDGAWTALRVGDRLQEVLGPGLRIDNTPATFQGRDARIREIRLRFGVSTGSPRTRLKLD